MTQSHVVSGDSDISLITPQPILKASGSLFCDHSSLRWKSNSGPNAKSGGQCAPLLREQQSHIGTSAVTGRELPRAGKYGLEATCSLSIAPPGGKPNPLFRGMTLGRPFPLPHPCSSLPPLVLSHFKEGLGIRNGWLREETM